MQERVSPGVVRTSPALGWCGCRLWLENVRGAGDGLPRNSAVVGKRTGCRGWLPRNSAVVGKRTGAGNGLPWNSAVVGKRAGAPVGAALDSTVIGSRTGCRCRAAAELDRGGDERTGADVGCGWKTCGVRGPGLVRMSAVVGKRTKVRGPGRSGTRPWLENARGARPGRAEPRPWLENARGARAWPLRTSTVVGKRTKTPPLTRPTTTGRSRAGPHSGRQGTSKERFEIAEEGRKQAPTANFYAT